MSENTIHILLIEDDLGDARLIGEMLADAPLISFTLVVERDLAAGLARLEQGHIDIVLLDLNLPDSYGLETLHSVLSQADRIPVIPLTGHDNEATGMQAVQEGAQDYLVKNHMNSRSLSHALRYAIERQRMIEEREKLIQDLDAFAHRVAHDLKNPLSIMMGYSELLSQDYGHLLDAEGANYLVTIIKHTHMMNNIIADLLLLATVRDLEIQLSPIVNMGDVIGEAQQRLAHTVADKAARIIQPDEWPVALGYAPWVEGVWVNYMSNALKYGHQPPSLELGAEYQADGMIRFWLCNEGPAIPAAAQEHLFKPFSRLDEDKKIEGHGLGLSIVRRIIEKLGGQVGVESSPERGNCFWFTLSAATSEDLSGTTPSL